LQYRSFNCANVDLILLQFNQAFNYRRDSHFGKSPTPPSKENPSN